MKKQYLAMLVFPSKQFCLLSGSFKNGNKPYNFLSVVCVCIGFHIAINAIDKRYAGQQRNNCNTGE